MISGGGSKGAFAVGVMQQLRLLFPLLKFDLLVGTSTGALIMPLAATGDLDLLAELYTSVRTEDIIEAHRLADRLNEKSIFTVDPLNRLLKTHVTADRFNAINANGKMLYIVTTCLQTQDVVAFTNNKAPAASALYKTRTLMDADHLRFAVLASACQPVFMTPIKVDLQVATGPEKDFQYVDGGVREYAGIQMAIDQGATEIFTILLSDNQGSVVNTEFKSLFPILQRSMSLMIEDVKKNDVYIPEQYANTLNYLQAVKQKMKADGVPQSKIDDYFRISGSANPLEAATGVKVFIIRPEKPLGGGPGGLVFDPVEMSRMLAIGNGVANDFAARLNPGDITWA